MDGLVDKAIINSHLLEPLMLLANLDESQPEMKLVDWIKGALLPGNQIMELDTWDGVMQNVLAGSTVILIEGVDKGISVETKGWEHRQVSVSQTEAVVRGPHDAFTENFRSNTGLIRARLRTPKLITKIVQVGKLARTDVAIMYIKDLTNPKLVNEVLRRIENLDVDYLPDTGMLEQLIEEIIEDIEIEKTLGGRIDTPLESWIEHPERVSTLEMYRSIQGGKERLEP